MKAKTPLATNASSSILREFVMALLQACAISAPQDQSQLAEQLAKAQASNDYFPLYRQCITVLSVQANREGNLPPMRKEEVDMLCFCVITCKSLREVIARASRFVAMLDGRGAQLTLKVLGAEAHFHMTTQRVRTSVSALLTDLYGLAFYRRLFAWLIGEDLPVDCYRVFATQTMERAVLERIFQRQIVFEQKDNSFCFAEHYLDKPVVRSPAELEEVLSVLPFDQMLEPSIEWQLSHTIAGIIHMQLRRNERIPTLSQIADFMNTSAATVHRRLKEQGTHYLAIKHHQCMDYAKELLLQEKLKVEVIAERLSFSDTRAFRRAFIAWTGMTPQDWRAQAQKQQRT